MEKFNKNFLYDCRFVKGDKPSKEEIESCKKNSTILAKDVYMSLDTDFTKRNSNIAVIGMAGTGKSRFFVKPNILQANTSFVVTDPSGDYLFCMETFLKSQGYKIKYLNLCDISNSMRYNPFAYITCDDDIIDMVKCLIINTKEPGAKFYTFFDAAEETLLSACCAYLYEVRPKEEQNFRNVRDMIFLCDLKKENPLEKLDELFENLYEVNSNSFACKQYRIFKVAAGKEKTAKAILISVSIRLNIFDIKDVYDLTTYDEMDLTNILQEKTAIFVNTSQSDRTYAFLASMLYTQLYNICIHYSKDKEKKDECTKPSIPIRFILDEFDYSFKIPDIEEKLKITGNYGYSSCLITHSLVNLKSNYPEEWKKIIEDCDTLLFYGNHRYDYQCLREITGQRTFKKIIKSKFLWFNNEKEVEVDLIEQGNYELNNNKCLVFVRGFKIFEANKYMIEEHPNYKGTFEE